MIHWNEANIVGNASYPATALPSCRDWWFLVGRPNRSQPPRQSESKPNCRATGWRIRFLSLVAAALGATVCLSNFLCMYVPCSKELLSWFMNFSFLPGLELP